MTIERGDIIGVILGKLQGNESEKQNHGFEVRMISAIPYGPYGLSIDYGLYYA